MQRPMQTGRASRHSMQAVSRIAFCLTVWLAAGAAHGGVGTAAGKLDLPSQAVRLVPAARLATLTVTDLRHVGPADGVVDLLNLAELESRFDPIKRIQLAARYREVDDGHILLFTCLKHPTCEPDAFLDIVNTSRLHAEVVRRAPGLSSAQVNQQVGAVTERLMNRYFENSGWTRIEGQIGRQGLDGLYIKRQGGVVRDVLVAESKYNSSSLQPTSAGLQMSETWVLRKVEELRQRFPDEGVYGDVHRFIDNGSYRAVIWQLRMADDAIYVALRKVKGKGDGVEILDPAGTDVGSLSSPFTNRIDLGNPSNSFQEQFLKWFNEELDAIGQLPN